MKNAKRFLSAAMAAVMLLSCAAVLSGCGSKQTAGDEYIYVPQYVTVKGADNLSISSVRYVGGQFYFSTYGEGGGVVYGEQAMSAGTAEASAASTAPTTGTDVNGAPSAAIYSLDLEGNAKKLDVYKPSAIPAGKQGSVSLAAYDVDKDGNVYIVEEMYLYHYNLPAGFTGTDDDKEKYRVEDGDNFTLAKYAKDGTKTYSVSLNALFPDGAYVSSIKCDDSGNLYLINNQTIMALDGSGKQMYKYDSTGWFDALIKFSDGRVGTIESQNSATSAEGTGSATSNLIAMDNKTKTAAVVCKLTSSAYGLFSGNSTYAAGYNNGAYLFAIDSTTGQGNVVLNWLSCNIDSDYISGVAFLDDGRVACLSNEYNQKTQTNTPELALLTKTKAADASQKKVLTLATQYLDPTLKSQVLDFNKTNPDYRIEVTDYSQYNTDADYSAGLKKMTTEILTGSVPDIIFTQGVNMDQLITKGIVTDLNQFMESDKEVGLDTISDNVLKALEVDGKLYEADSSYTLFTVMGNPAIVGTTPGWTVDDLNAAFKKMPEGSTIFDNTVAQADILNLCLAMDMSDYVNWATGECSFDKGGFQKLLEFAKSFPSKIDWDNYDWESYQDPAIRVAAGKQMLLQSYISAFSDYMMYKTEFGGKMTCIGFPTANGVGNMLYMNSGYAISAKCADKAGAWQFVRTFLTKDFQESNMNGFPTNKAAFSDALKQAMTPQYQKDENGKYVLDKNGNKIEQPLGSIQNANNETVNYYALKQSDADEIMQIINSTDKIIKYDENIVNIMKDDCDAYFSGEKSAEETAKLIQSSVSIYVNEQS